jgi:hypothetical protein
VFARASLRRVGVLRGQDENGAVLFGAATFRAAKSELRLFSIEVCGGVWFRFVCHLVALIPSSPGTPAAARARGLRARDPYAGSSFSRHTRWGSDIQARYVGDVHVFDTRASRTWHMPVLPWALGLDVKRFDLLGPSANFQLQAQPFIGLSIGH